MSPRRLKRARPRRREELRVLTFLKAARIAQPFLCSHSSYHAISRFRINERF